MQNTIDQITDYLVGLVTSDKSSYNPKELLKANIPSFIVERVRLHLEDKIKEDLSALESPWFDAESKLVKESMNDFILAAVSTSQIPKTELYNVLQLIVRDVIKVFIEPRKNFADYVFRDNDELDYNEMALRCTRITIYKHFATAIPLYMKKKGLKVLSRDRCKMLIQKLDAKLVSSYTPQDWAQKLEQLFVLFGGKIEPKLLATFFEDKGLLNIAQKFSNKRKPVTKTDFIYIISNEDLADFNVVEVEQEETPAPEKKVDESKERYKNEDKEESLLESFFGDYKYENSDKEEEETEESDSLAGSYIDGGLSDDEMNELLSDIAQDGVVDTDSYHQVESLNELFSHQDEDDESVQETSEEIAATIKKNKDGGPEEIKEFRENLISILDQAKNSFENIKDEDEAEEENAEEVIEVQDTSDVVIEDEPLVAEEDSEEPELPEGEERPMWAQFLSSDQMEVMMGGKRNKDKKEVPYEAPDDIEVEDEVEIGEGDPIEIDEDGFPAEDNAQTTVEYAEKLFNILDDRKEEFVEVVFSGSEDNYVKAVEKISGFGGWKETSTFIQKDIFVKNDVDLFSGATVDFTDRLQQFFNELPNE